MTRPAGRRRRGGKGFFALWIGLGIGLLFSLLGSGLARADRLDLGVLLEGEHRALPGPRDIRLDQAGVLTVVDRAGRTASGGGLSAFRWFEVRPEGGTGMGFEEAPLAGLDDRPDVSLKEVVASVGRSIRPGVYRFRVETVRSDGVRLSSPSGAAAFRLTFRRDDSYLGWLETFRGVPYKFGSSQAEVREYRAADCADFVVGGYQKMGGAGLGDMGTMTMLGAWAGLFDVIHGEVDWSVTPCLDTRTRNPVTWGPEAVRPGDIVLYKGHVGVLTRDQPPLGLLDPEDMVIHHLYQPPRETPLAEVWSGPLAVIRWKDFSPWQRRLKELGLYSGRVDGIFNAELERAVRKVQKNKGLKTDGRPSRETWRAVGGL